MTAANPTFEAQLQNARALLAEMAAIEQRIGPQMRATMQVDGPMVIDGKPFVAIDAATPKPLVPLEGYTLGLNDRLFSLVNGTINVQQPVQLGFDLNTAVYAITGAAYSTAGAAFPPTGFANALDAFTVQFKLAQGRQYQTNPILGSAIIGDAKFPRFLGMPAWRLPGGTVLQALITPLVANIRIDITIWCIEMTPYGGNIN
jgi:hypothetical protein